MPSTLISHSDHEEVAVSHTDSTVSYMAETHFHTTHTPGGTEGMIDGKTKWMPSIGKTCVAWSGVYIGFSLSRLPMRD